MDPHVDTIKGRGSNSFFIQLIKMEIFLGKLGRSPNHEYEYGSVFTSND